MREFEQAFAQQVEEFLTVYPTYIEQVRPELNGLFREEDYPSTEKLRNKFGVKLEVLPIPSGNDSRVTLSEEEQARVAREIDENVRQSLQKGTEDLWTRLKGVVAHMVERPQRAGVALPSLAGDQYLRPSRVASAPQCEPGRRINRFAEEIRDRLCGFRRPTKPKPQFHSGVRRPIQLEDRRSHFTAKPG